MRNYVFADDGPFHADWPLSVLPDMVCLHDGFVVSDGRWHAYDEIQRMFLSAAQTAPANDDGPAPPPTKVPDVYEQFPWLLQFLSTGECGQASEMDSALGNSVKTSGRHGQQQVVAPEEDVDAEVVFDALEAKRLELNLADARQGHDFFVSLIGGTWQNTHLNGDYNCFRGYAHGAFAEGFCDEFGLQKTFSCSIKEYGEDNAHAVCRAWCGKMQWLYDKYLSEGSAVDFSEATLGRFSEDAEVGVLYEASGGKLRQRISSVRKLMPRSSK